MSWLQITDDMSMLEVALAIAGAGVYVFPVDHSGLPECAGIGDNHNPKTCHQRGKHPAVKFTVAADTSPKMIAMWFSGALRNIGINCGRSGLVVIDEDKVGELKRYADVHGVKIPPTFVVRTAKGRHYYFRAREGQQIGNTRGAFKDYSIDVRGHNGYVVAPGSIHETGVEYSILVDLPPAPIPDWVTDAVTRTNGATAPGEWETVASGNGYAPRGLAAVPGVIRGPRADSGGERHDVLVRYASSLRARSLPYDEAKLLFKSTWQRCEQPPACSTPLPWDEALGKLRDVYERYAEGPSAEFQRERDADEGDTGEKAEPKRQLILTSAATIKPKRVKWLWLDRLALGTLALLAGAEGLGKSTIAYDRCARITRGELEGEFYGQPKSVLVCATEDSWEHTIVPRLMAHHADLTKVFRVEVLDEEVHGGLVLPKDIKAVEEAAAATDAAILLLDPLMSRIDKKIDTHKDADVRLALEPMAALAHKANLCVWGIIHHNKSGSSDALQLVMGSKAFAAVARSVHTVVKDPDDENKRLFGMPKNNLGRTDLDTLAFTIASHAIETDEGTAWTGRIEWGGVSDTTISEAMRQHADKDDDGGATAEAAEWLKVYMTSMGGSKESAKVKAAGKAAGHSEAAVKRAKTRLNIEHKNRGFPSKTWWFLPGFSENDTTDGSQLTPVGSAPGESDLTALTEPTGGVGAVGSVGSAGSSPREADLTEAGGPPLDPVANGHTVPPGPVFADGAAQLNLFAGEPETVRTKVRPNSGTCAVCGDHMTIAEDGQTTHPGCGVAQ